MGESLITIPAQGSEEKGKVFRMKVKYEMKWRGRREYLNTFLTHFSILSLDL